MNIYKVFELEFKEYSPDKIYKKNDTCIYGDQEFVCLVDNPHPMVPLFSNQWDSFKP